MSAWAYSCNLCGHLSSRHRSAGPGFTDPFVCRECGCETTLDGPVSGLTEREARARHSDEIKRNAEEFAS